MGRAQRHSNNAAHSGCGRARVRHDRALVAGASFPARTLLIEVLLFYKSSGTGRSQTL